MRKEIKRNIIEILDTIFEAHSVIEKSIDLKKNQEVNNLLADCQETAIYIGGCIEKSEGENCDAIYFLNEYCKTLYNISVENSGILHENNVKEVLDKKLSAVKCSVENIKVKFEVVFMPYKASMWDSLESIWKAANEDPDCSVYVVPIPYYERNRDRSFGKFHYEGNDFPKYVPVTSYVTYDLAKRKPDIIYVHNPYDGGNFVTSVAPRFYSDELKKYTNNLVYVPYGIFEEVNPEDADAVEGTFHFTLTPVVINADKIFVQSENMRMTYINAFLKYFGNTIENKKKQNEKIYGFGSPKYDKVLSVTKNDVDIPEQWLKLMKKCDGTYKKIFFYNTGITDLLKKDSLWIDEIEKSLLIFESYTDDIVLLWRPHPLIESTLQSMKPHLLKRYLKIKSDYLHGSWGIFDDTPDLNRAIALGDCFYGNWSSIEKMFLFINKKVLLSDDINVLEVDLQKFINTVCKENNNNSKINNDGIECCGNKIHEIMINEVKSV